ncbi:MAG TPA: hypothetical protein VFE40_06110 [Jatrophihabitantaceae bacterium]|jgi:hypothetical protein|nr:hypothetical protein [Jatrophihabitantaceae bacterium]
MTALVSFYRHIAFDLPRTTTAAGIALLLGMAAIRLCLLAEHDQPTYLAAYFTVLGACAMLAALGMLAGRWLAIVRAGWALGSVVALASLAMYLASRTIGLPQLPQLIGRWDYAPGTLGMVLSGAFLATHFAVLTGRTVSWPLHQEWHD